MAKANKSWAIRSFSKEAVTGNWTPFMESYYPTREKMRAAWKTLPAFMKESAMFYSTRLRVTDYELINKRSYEAVR